MPSLYTVSSDRMADFLLRMIGTPSPSGSEEAVARVVAAEMRNLGFSVEVDDFGNVIGSIGRDDHPCVLLDAHLDTVGVGTPGAWTTNPWGERKGKVIFGRGAMDMKGPLAAAIYGVAQLGDSLKRGRVVVSATLAEELVEGPVLAEVAKRVEPNFVIICEATSLKIARGQRGRMEIKVEVFGKGTHTSRPELGINAADVMADVISALRQVEPTVHPVLGKGILVLTDVKSEPYPGLSVVPHYCVATYDRRILPGEGEEILEVIRARAEDAVQGTGASVRVSVGVDDFVTYTGRRVVAPNFARAWYFQEDEPIVKAAMRALDKVGIRSELSHYAFCTNGSVTAADLGIPTIGFGPGDEELAHRPDEHVELAQLATAAAGYAALAQELLSL